VSRSNDGVRRLGQAFVEHDLLTYASAISFQVFSAIVPFLMFAVALMGFLDLGGLWTDHLAPDLKPQVSDAAFTVIDDAVRTALESKQGFWLTAGFLLALWQISGAVRAIMGALNRLYRTGTRRSWIRRMLVSFALSLAVATCFLLALLVVVAGPLVFADAGGVARLGLFGLRYAVAAVLFLIAVALLVHYAPEQHQPLSAVGFGSALIIGAWIVMSGGFGFYLTEVASYGSVLGSLAALVVLIGYIYASALVFLGGVQIDALVREGARAAKHGSYAAGGAPA
jgi:membrane protein